MTSRVLIEDPARADLQSAVFDLAQAGGNFTSARGGDLLIAVNADETDPRFQIEISRGGTAEQRTEQFGDRVLRFKCGGN